MEEELTAGLGEREIAQFIHDDEVEPGDEDTEGGADLATYLANTAASDGCAIQIHKRILQHTQKAFDPRRNIARSIRTNNRRNKIMRRK